MGIMIRCSLQVSYVECCWSGHPLRHTPSRVLYLLPKNAFENAKRQHKLADIGPSCLNLGLCLGTEATGMIFNSIDSTLFFFAARHALKPKYQKA